MKLKHVIWDWNGTLWDDTWLCHEIAVQMLERRGLPVVSLEAYREHFHFPVENYYRWLGFDLEQEPFPELAEAFISAYEARRFECELQTGARELLRFLDARGTPQTVLSAYKQEMLLQAVAHYGLSEHFGEVIGLNDIYAASKVENGKAYMARLQLPPEEVLFVGDTLHDFEVAQAMGVQCVLVTTGHNSRSRLEACGMPVFDSLVELQQHVIENIEY